MTTLTKSPAWQQLSAHHDAIEGVHMRELFAKDPARFSRMSHEACGLFVDWSKHRATDETMKLLVQLAEQAQVARWRDAMFSGENHSLTPALVDTLPGPLHEAIITSYNDGLVPIFTVLVPFALVASAILFFTREEKLKETVE